MTTGAGQSEPATLASLRQAGFVTEIPAENYAQAWAADTRQPLPRMGNEREILTAFLDWHRETFQLKCTGVPADRLNEMSVAPSALSLHGLLRHLAATERWWFRQQFAREPVAHLYYSDDDPNQDFEDLTGDIDEAFTVWHEECQRAREIVAGAASLDETGIQASTGEPISLRRILVHMIAEYARHNGHADLLRERIDGATGY
jgi:Protein of unknown function (DUF664)